MRDVARRQGFTAEAMGPAITAGLGLGLAISLLAEAVTTASGYHPGEPGALPRLADWAGHSAAWQTGPALLALATAALLLRALHAPRLGPAGPLAAMVVAAGAGLASGLPAARLSGPELAALALLAAVGPSTDRWALLAAVAAGALAAVPPAVPAALCAFAVVRTIARLLPSPREFPPAATMTLVAVAVALACAV